MEIAIGALVVVIVLLLITRSQRPAEVTPAPAPRRARRPARAAAPSRDSLVLPDNALELPRGQRVDVVGESLRREAFDAYFGPRTEDGVRATVTVTLVHERTNAYDPNAVAVHLDGRMIGYIGRQGAAALAPVLDRIEAAGRVPYARASVRGGWDRGDGDEGEYGMTLDIAAPDELLALVES